MSFRRSQLKSTVNTTIRSRAADRDNLLQENIKLHSDITQLETALQLHHELTVKEDNSVQGMLRKEIGATRWQYGGSGKLHGYKSASDLKEPHGLTLETATQRRRRAKVVAHRPGFCAGRPSMISHPDDSSSADECPTDMANYPDRCSTRYTPGSKQSKRNRRINNKHSTLSSTSAKENDVQDLFPVDPLKIDELKHKVLEKVGARVIKRPSPHSAKSNDDASSESHLKNEHCSLKVKPSPHRSKLSCKQGHQGYPNIQSESANQPCDGLQSKHISSTKSPMMKNIIEPLQERFVVSVNCDKQDKVCATEKRSIQTSDYSSDVETFSDKVEESVPFSGFNSNHNAFSPLCSNESDSGAGKHMSRNNVEHSSVKNRKCLSDDVEDTPILGIKSVFSASSASSLSERNVSKQDCSLQTKENAKPDHDVEVWLRNIGLKNCDKYVELFATHEIEMSCLKYLTAELLNQMGITAVGPVNKILIAILNLEEYMPTPGSHAERHRTPTPTSNTQTLSSSAATSDSLIQTPRPMSEDSISFTDRSTPHTPILTPKVKDCIPEFTSDLQKKYKDMNVEHGKVNVQNDLVKCDNVKENLGETYTINSETSQQKSKTYTIKSETSQPKSKTLMTKRSCSASRVVADDRPAGKPRTQSRSANVSTARQRDSLSSKREGKKDKVQTSGERSITSRSSAPNKLTTDIVQKKADIGQDKSKLKKQRSISLAAQKIENRQKQEQDERNVQLKLMKKRKQRRDEMAAKYLDKKTEVKPEVESVSQSTTPLSIAAVATHDMMSSTESEETLLKIVLNTKRGQETPTEPDRVAAGKPRPSTAMSRPSTSMPRPSTAMPRPSTAMPPSEKNTELLVAAEETGLSARDRLKHVDLTVFKSQTKIHRRLTLDMVKELQKQLEEIEKEITNTEGSSENRTNIEQHNEEAVKSTHVVKLSSERTPVLDDKTEQKDQTTSGSKTTCDTKKAEHSAGSVMTISRSKRALLDEIRKEKDEHRKQIRHLKSELSRLQHKDPVRKSELDAKDIIFSEKDIIGEGAFSQVFRGQFQGAEVAIKRLKVPLSSQDRNYFAAEVSLLRELRHPRIVMLVGVCTAPRLPLMVLEYLAEGNLFSILHSPARERFDHAEYYQIARDIALGMVYLHNQRPAVLHLDLKSINVLIGIANRAKIADFGFSKLKHDVSVKAAKSDKGRQIQGSPAWMAPEMVQGGEVTVKTDVYSFAIILWEMLTRKIPYEHCSIFQILEMVRLGKRPAIPEDCPPQLSAFVQRCWDGQPARRPPFKEVLATLENLSFPPDWRALFEQAGVPGEALENLQSTRNIISLVVSTLESSQLQNVLDNSQSSDQVESLTSVTDETEGSTENSVADEPGEKEKLSLEDMSEDSLENPETKLVLDEERLLASHPTHMKVKVRHVEEKRSENEESSQLKSLQPPTCLVPFDGKMDATSLRKSFEAWTEECIDRSSDDNTDMCVPPAAPHPAPPHPAPPHPPPPLPPPTAMSRRREIKQLRPAEKVKLVDRVPLQAKNNVTSQMLKEKSLGLKMLAAKTKDAERNDSKSKRPAKPVQNGSFILAASELQNQRCQLKSITCPHPNQLQDLNMVSKKDLYSIAEILKRAMSERRFAMGEVHTSVDTDVSQSQAELSWSTHD